MVVITAQRVATPSHTQKKINSRVKALSILSTIKGLQMGHERDDTGLHCEEYEKHCSVGMPVSDMIMKDYLILSFNSLPPNLPSDIRLW